MASLSELERTANWHLALGYALRRIKTPRHLLAAVEEFRHAVQKTDDPSYRWVGHLGEADALFSLEEYREAITAASHALESIPAENTRKILLVRLIRDANLRMGNHEAALAASEKAWESVPHSPSVAFSMIYTYHKTGRFSSTVGIIKSLLNKSRSGIEFLGRILRQVRPTAEYISIACAETGQLDLARDAFTAVASQAAEDGNNSEHALADGALAQLYYRFYQDDEKAIMMWENIVKDHPSTMAAVYASFALAPLYLTNATDSAADADSWVSKLKQLVKHWEFQTNLGAEEEIPVEEVSALMGRWYANRGEADLAREKILPLVKRGIRDLTDRDDRNDRKAYLNLGRALACFGDRTNAEIAYAFTKPLRKSKELLDLEASANESRPVETEPFEHEGNTEPTVPFGFMDSCDGRCNRRKVNFRSFSSCEVCIDKAFCDECLQKLMDGNLSFRVCNPKHPFLQTYPPRGLVTRGAEGYMVRISDERVVSADDWLGMISREWLGA